MDNEMKENSKDVLTVSAKGRKADNCIAELSQAKPSRQEAVMKQVADKLKEGDYVDEVGNIRLCPERRQAIIESFFQGKIKAAHANELQEIVLSGGLAGAGKTTCLHGLGIDEHKYIMADSDIIKVIADYDDVAPLIHEESSDMNKEIAARAIQEGYHLIYVSMLTNYEYANGLIQRILNNGGCANIVFVDIDCITSQVRARLRNLRGVKRIIIPDVTIKGYNQSLPTFRVLYEKYKDNPQVSMGMYDNNVDDRNGVAVFSKKIGNSVIVTFGDKEEEKSNMGEKKEKSPQRISPPRKRVFGEEFMQAFHRAMSSIVELSKKPHPDVELRKKLHPQSR